MPAKRIVDAAYGAMIEAIRSDKAPNLIYLHYKANAGVQNLFIIPRFFFVEQCIEARKALGPSARRAGWIGCNIRLDRIAPEGRIDLIVNGEQLPAKEVRDRFRKTLPLRDVPPGLRGWALAILLHLHSLGKDTFSLAEAYAGEHIFATQFPNNRNVKAKIRQQLQILRDVGLLEFLGSGQYRFTD